MTLSSIGYLLRETGRSLRRNLWMTVASVSTVAISLFVLAVFVVVSTNVTHVTTLLQNQVELKVFIKPKTNRAQEMALLKQVRVWPDVRRVEFFTKVQAAAQLRREFPDQQALFQVIAHSNPLLDGYDVFTHTPDQIPAVAHRFARERIVHNVIYQGTIIKRLTGLGRIVKWSGWIVEALLAAATLLIIINTIRLAVFARRREIQVMRLVGATNWFIRWPFILEGLVIGLLGTFLSELVVGLGYRWVLARAAIALPFWPMVNLHTIMVRTTLFTGLGGLAVGTIASVIALRRFLRV
ncbi:MAG: ABC transporter permease [Sulfobacillus acidophilus]|uniref:Cell division protein FtsX n=1 Tax=Sulfobacillus acidophilus TaxID=53633 RepID=A0A2T2WMJ0_9FIRM|nr:MAG: ABC transporter permease [Sulfobacillus acidophilus]